MLRQQRYISNELTHFVGARLPEQEDQYSLLLTILRSGLLKVPGKSDYVESSDASGPVVTRTSTTSVAHGKKLSSNDKYRASIVCFADIPIDDLHLHITKYSKFGLAFTRRFLLGKGANPVFYIAQQSSTDVRNPLANDPDNYRDLVELAKKSRNTGHWENFTRADLFDIAEVPLADVVNRVFADPPPPPPLFSANSVIRQFVSTHLFQFMKFFDAELSDDDPSNFYMEREWRVVGPVKFAIADVERVLIPRAFARRLREDIPSYFGQVSFAD